MDNRNNGNNKSEFFSWFVIILLFAGGGWPIALFLLIRKLFSSDIPRSQRREAPYLSKEQELKRQQEELERMKKKFQQEQTSMRAKQAIRSILKSPKEDKNTSWLMTIAGALIMALAIFWGIPAAIQSGTVYTVSTALGALLGGGCILTSGVLMRRAMQRYTAYLAIIGPNEAMEIDTIAKKVGVKRKQAEQDLQKMIEKGYFGDSAYINKELGYIFMSSRADEELARAREAAMQKTREASKKEAVKQNAEAYDQILAKIRDVNDRIPDAAMTEKINQIESITQQIFRAVEREPEKRGKIDRFMSYFLPTTLKLLESYANLEKTNIDGKNINQSMRSIEIAMDTVVDGFKHQLDELYKSDAVSIETEIDVLTKMINRETVTTQKEFGLGGQAVQTAPQQKIQKD
ncbi:MAG: 5-bromo-4-chloroindolyl phosphate hydrolysis family protein [Oscillospiraceae bacterium]|nr:5-bromo-4-chloroindolyl phosphate hydrolysis family protein [Oscillospiraceae bacterium]